MTADSCGFTQADSRSTTDYILAAISESRFQLCRRANWFESSVFFAINYLVCARLNYFQPLSRGLVTQTHCDRGFGELGIPRGRSWPGANGQGFGSSAVEKRKRA